MSVELTKSELELMQVLWSAGYPLSRADILNHAEGKSWKDSYIHLLLNGLLKKEAIVEAGFVRSGKTWGRVYAANIGFEEYYSETVFSKIPPETLPQLCAALLEHEGLTPEFIEKLESIVQERKKAI